MSKDLLERAKKEKDRTWQECLIFDKHNGQYEEMKAYVISKDNRNLPEDVCSEFYISFMKHQAVNDLRN
jgi:hypothetical protein